MSVAWAVARRDLAGQFQSPWGYWIIAAILMLEGTTFNAFALGRGPQYSTEVLRTFFYGAFGFTCVASIVFSMRSFAEERQLQTMLLLDGAAVGPWHLVLGKLAAAWAMVSILLVTSAYIPALIFVHGKVSLGHLAAGYFGLWWIAGVVCAIGVFASACVRSQLLAAVMAALITTAFVTAWMTSRVTEAPFSTILAYSSLFEQHFSGFRDGRIASESVIYLLSLIGSFASGSAAVLTIGRWR